MSYAVIENPVTGERALRRHAPSDGSPLVADLYARPGAAVVGEHVHPHARETFTVVRGTLGVRVGGVESHAVPGTRVVVPPGTPHDWWTVGDETAFVIVEVDPGHRFEAMIRNLFGLAADGRADSAGRPGLLQAALLAREFDDTIRFTSPPRAVQRPLFAALAPIARMRGLQGRYEKYEQHTGATVEELETIPPEIAVLLPALTPDHRG
ncbi:cupin domain-containing protein [Kineosporia sp. A_224]|uniref:cupin domain-containing protein n=1 Tax=Kineosporia sp. A_224 TaxID=1962180 RepID=UPI000B4AA3B6|nr:cupin domain-containing protein [Kineosporia sp. A_224]